MQSGDGDSALHSCFASLKNTIMGCCYGICQKENDPQEPIINERTCLLETAQQQVEAPAPAAAITPPFKPDEQSALNRILHETSNNVIDVSALGPYTLEPAVYSERVRAYTARLSSTTCHHITPPRLLRDVSHADRNVILHKPPLAFDDKELITNAVRKAAASLSELKVEHREDLVVPFRVP